MKKHLFLFTICCLTFLNSFAQGRMEMPLWPNGIPESNGIIDPEVTKDGRISNVTVPAMTVYPAESTKNTGVAILICPGGGYKIESSINEGSLVAQWLSENGITAFVLKYRLPNRHSNIPLKDAQQALKIIRSKAAEWKISPNKIGISGYSAGGHLASTAGTHFNTGDSTDLNPLNKLSCRPDFMILFYPVISMQDGVTHSGSKSNLLGGVNNKDSVNYFSNELQVNKTTPPTLLFLSDDDKAVIPRNSIDFYSALKTNGIPASIHIYPEGGHGWGFNKNFRYHENWKGLYLDWLKQQKFIQ